MAVTFSNEVFDRICERIANGESLRSICEDDDMPTRSSFLRWLADEKNADLRDRYARAREAQADRIFDEILEIADDARNDWMETENGPVLNQEHVQRSRLRIDARKWMAGKLRPKVYGDKINLEHEGEVKMTPVINFNGSKTV